MGDREQLERRKEVVIAQWRLYLSVIGVLFIVFGGSMAIVLVDFGISIDGMECQMQVYLLGGCRLM